MGEWIARCICTNRPGRAGFRDLLSLSVFKLSSEDRVYNENVELVCYYLSFRHNIFVLTSFIHAK